MRAVDRLRAIRTSGWWGRHGWWVWTTAGVVLGVVATLVGGMLVASDGPADFEPGEIVILSGLDESAGGQRQALIDQWNRRYPDNRATIVEMSADADAQHAQLVADAQSGDSDVDIYNLDVTLTAEFAAAGFIRELDESDLDTTGFLAGPLQTCRYDGRLWALPFNTDAGLLYYRSDLVRRPGDWEDVRVDIERVLGAGPVSGVTAGYAGQLAPYEGLTVNALEAVQSVVYGSVVVDDRVNVSLGQLEEAVGRLRPTAGTPQVVLPESLDHRESDTTAAFRDGRVLYMRNWPVAYHSITEQAAREPTTAAVPFDVAPLPGPGVLGGQNLAIAERTDQPRAAQALIEFLTSDYSEQILFERGGFAATRGIVYDDPDVQQRRPYAATLLQAVRNAQPRPVTPCYARFSETLRTAVDTALRDDEALPADTVDTLNAALADCPD